jgi:RNA polymerase sigma factor (sigma-70 family)
LNKEEIIIACKKNDREAQNLLYHSYKDILFLQSLKYSKSTEEAEDNLHDAFVIIFTSIKKYRNEGSFEGWMKRIVINKAIDNFKKSKSKISLEIKEGILEDTYVEEETFNIPFDTVLKTIQQLPDQYRLVFSLYQLDGYSHKEISKMLSISEGTSKSNLHRAKVILKKQLLEAGFKSQTNL